MKERILSGMYLRLTYTAYSVRVSCGVILEHGPQYVAESWILEIDLRQRRDADAGSDGIDDSRQRPKPHDRAHRHVDGAVDTV